MRNLALIGREVFGNSGFIARPNGTYINGKDMFLEQIDRIKKCLLLDNLYMTRLISNGNLKVQGYKYLPNIMTFSKEYNSILEPYSIHESYIKGLRMGNVDFIVWNKEDNINVMTYTKLAPVLYFETENGTYCLGTIGIKALKRYGEYVLSQIFNSMDVSAKNKVRCTIASYFKFDSSNISCNINILDYIWKLLNKMDNVISVDTKYNVFSEKECFCSKYEGNHVIVSM